MNNLTLASIAAALLISASAPAMAQVSIDTGGGASVDAGGGASVSTGNGGSSVDAGAGANVSGNANADANSNAGGNGNANAAGNASGNADVGASSNAGGNGDRTFGAVISTLNSSAGSSIDLSSVNDQTDIQIVVISSLQGEGDANAKALDNAINQAKTKLENLRADIETHAAIKAELEASGFTSDDVVAVAADASGSVIVYVDDRG